MYRLACLNFPCPYNIGNARAKMGVQKTPRFFLPFSGKNDTAVWRAAKRATDSSKRLSDVFSEILGRSSASSART